MTRDEIIRMAWQAFSDPSKEDAWRNGFWTVNQEELDDFAALVAAAEREACAKVCENEHKQRELYFEQTGNGMPTVGLLVSAAAIRARGKE